MTGKIVEFFAKLPAERRALLNEFIDAYYYATDSERARIFRFLDIENEKGYGLDGMRLIVAAGRGNQDAIGIIDATLEEVGA